jgi:hypothetical protein
MREAIRYGLLLGVAAAASACTSLLGGFDTGDPGAGGGVAGGNTGGTSSAGGTAGTSSSTSDGSGGSGATGGSVGTGGAGGTGAANGGGSGTGGEGGEGGAGGGDCPDGLGDCDALPGCETDLTGDPANCGACGAVCLGRSRTCSASACSDVTQIASGRPEANFVAVTGGEVYWTAGEDESGSVQKVSVRGGRITTLAANQDAPYGIAVNSTHVYWVNRNSATLMKVGRNGGMPELLVETDGGAPLGVAADDRQAYWSQRSGNPGEVGPGSLIGSINVADDAVNGMFLPVDSTSPHLLTLDEDFIYFADRQSTGSVIRASRTDGSFTPLVTGQPRPYDITVDSGHVYWTNNGEGAMRPGGVMRAPKAGGAAIALGTGHFVPNGIAVDETHAYWTDQGSGKVRRILKDGSGTAQDLYTGDSPRGIAVDATHVYWVGESDTGPVFKRRKM